jgi:tRNA 2-selenouridine synthase
MAIGKVNISQLLKAAKDAIIFDVRSEGEFANGHIPGAISFPIFNNEERKKVGTAYKQESRVVAVNIGLKIFKEKMSQLLRKAEQLKEEQGKTEIIVYCWRGGLRSNTMAWLLQLYGTPISILKGGYKTYRRWALDLFQQDYPIQIVGGFTGSAKTEVLHSLSEMGEKIIDLEDIAHHKGSAFGHIGMPVQHKQEHFENLLALELYNSSFKDGILYLEDESQRIGNNSIPNTFWNIMRQKKIYYLDIPFEIRLQHLVEEYGILSKDELFIAIEKITKNLGGLATKEAKQFLAEDKFSECFSILLLYYDKYYTRGLEKREDWKNYLETVPCLNADPGINANKLIDLNKNDCRKNITNRI